MTENNANAKGLEIIQPLKIKKKQNVVGVQISLKESRNKINECFWSTPSTLSSESIT